MKKGQRMSYCFKSMPQLYTRCAFLDIKMQMENENQVNMTRKHGAATLESDKDKKYCQR